MAAEGWTGLTAIYLCPLKALLNNLLPRLETYGGWTGRRVALWHGDTQASRRTSILADPPDVLLTTPESLESMLVSVRVDHYKLFADLRAVIVDEVHAFGGGDRGWHLLAVLERLTRISGRPLQRIGLSATVGNPDELLRWLQGSAAGQRQGMVVAPELEQGSASPAALPQPDVQLDYVGSLSNAAKVIASLHRGEKRLVFCDSKRTVELLGAELRERGVTTHLVHASLSLDERRRAEQAFAEGRDCVIVSTSALELGIDVGDLDRVVQINAPLYRCRLPPAPRPQWAALWHPAELSFPRRRRGGTAARRRSPLGLEPWLRGAGGCATRTPAHHCPATARPVPARKASRRGAVARLARTA
jgi:ATP-dependent Lhr-like helicase